MSLGAMKQNGGWIAPNQAEGRLIGVPVVVERQSAAQQLVSHDASSPDIRLWHNLAA